MTDAAPLLEARDLHFAYAAERPVLAGADLTLRPGERLALTGGNGSGKTTLLHLLVGLERPAAGRILAFGRERRSEEDFHEVRCRAGLLFQDPDDQLFCPTVLEDVAFGPLNLGLPPAAARARAERTLARLDLEHCAHRLTTHLSGGEKHLAALATVLAMEPEVLLLDEPAAGLDATVRDRLVEHLKALPQALVLVSHEAAVRRALCTGRLHLEAGRCLPA
jgi:cobalt/nickel transport system ATP-binding protein